jgi:hypothetical protein
METPKKAAATLGLLAAAITGTAMLIAPVTASATTIQPNQTHAEASVTPDEGGNGCCQYL